MIAKNGIDLPLVLSAKDVAELLGVSMTTVYHLIDSGAIRSVRVRRQIRVSRDSFLSFINGENKDRKSVV